MNEKSNKESILGKIEGLECCAKFFLKQNPTLLKEELEEIQNLKTALENLQDIPEELTQKITIITKRLQEKAK